MAQLATTSHAMTRPSIDPVCGVKVDVNTTDFMTTYQGHDYYFCAEACRRKFEANPKKYPEPRHAIRKEPKTWWGRYLERVAKSNEKLFGGRPHCCH
jgi:YHS domain-containing protein